jgi:hypothetical protein
MIENYIQAFIYHQTECGLFNTAALQTVYILTHGMVYSLLGDFLYFTNSIYLDTWDGV